MELFYIINKYTGEEEPLLFCKDLCEARSYVMREYVNTGKRTILRKTYSLECTEEDVLDTNY